MLWPEPLHDAAQRVLNTEWWTETRRSLLANDATAPAACTDRYTLNDPWRRDM